MLRFLPVAAAIAALVPAMVLGEGLPSSEAPSSSTMSSSEMVSAPVGPPTVSSYTEDQAKRGKTAYDDNCSVCHGGTLGGSGEIPALAGKGFRERQFVGSIEAFMTFISTRMPQADPGGLDAQTYADIAAFLMSRNHVPAGDVEIPADKAAWANITLPPLE